MLEYNLPLPEFIPNHKISYSDHEAVYSKLAITDRKKSEIITCKVQDKVPSGIDFERTLQEAIHACDDILKRLQSDKRCYLLMAFTLFMIFLYILDIYPPYGWRTLYLIFKVFISGIIIFFVFMATIWNSIEYNGILSSKRSMEMSLEMSKVIEEQERHMSCF